MEADLSNMIDLEVKFKGEVLGTVVIDKEWSLSAVRTEIFSVFADKAPEEFEFWIVEPDAKEKKVSHRREPHTHTKDFVQPKVLEIRVPEDD